MRRFALIFLKQAGRQTGRQAGRQADGRAGGQVGRRADRQAGRQAGSRMKPEEDKIDTKIAASYAANVHKRLDPLLHNALRRRRRRPLLGVACGAANDTLYFAAEATSRLATNGLNLCRFHSRVKGRLYVRVRFYVGIAVQFCAQFAHSV
jgi:hypothetical protein